MLKKEKPSNANVELATLSMNESLFMLLMSTRTLPNKQNYHLRHLWRFYSLLNKQLQRYNIYLWRTCENQERSEEDNSSIFRFSAKQLLLVDGAERFPRHEKRKLNRTIGYFVEFHRRSCWKKCMGRICLDYWLEFMIVYIPL